MQHIDEIRNKFKLKYTVNEMNFSLQVAEPTIVLRKFQDHF